MNEAKVRAMRADWDKRWETDVTQGQLAAKYDVTQATVSFIVNRITWAEVK